MSEEVNRKVLNIILKKIKRGEVSKELYSDTISILMQFYTENLEDAREMAKQVFNALNNVPATDVRDMALVSDTKKHILRLEAPYNFDAYLRYIEWNREPSKKFYPARRKALLPVVNALQDLADGKLDLLTVSLPPGVGKSTTAIFFLCWLAGKNPEKPILGASHSASFMRGVYDEALRVLDKNGEYLWHDVFPKVEICNTNAKDMQIDLGDSKRFPTLEFTSIGAGNAGKVRAENLLYCDDLVDGIETALNVERLNKLYEQYKTDLRQRKIGACKELHIATRWSVHDVIGQLQDKYEDSDRARFISVPALNENDESNFDYACSAGFTTEFYHEQRDIMDDLSWKALYMNEPIEREGLLYDEDELNRYYSLPETDPDAVIAICDTKDGGNDYCVMPVVYQYGDRFYVEDVVCTDALPEQFTPRLADKLIKNHVKLCRFESNSAGGVIADNVEKILKERGGFTHITKKYTTTNKETKIIVNSPFVKEHFYFKDKTQYAVKSEYGIFMKFLCSYTLMGKNKHDDCPDAIAMLADFVQNLYVNTVSVIKRPF